MNTLMDRTNEEWLNQNLDESCLVAIEFDNQPALTMQYLHQPTVTI